MSENVGLRTTYRVTFGLAWGPVIHRQDGSLTFRVYTDKPDHLMAVVKAMKALDGLAVTITSVAVEMEGKS